MKKTQAIDLVAGEIAASKLDWNSIIETYKSHPNFHPGKQFNLGDYLPAFRQIHLNNVLNGLITNHSLPFEVHRVNVESDKEYHFNNTKRGVVFVKNGLERTLCKYDALVDIDEVPTIVTIKTGSFDGKNGVKEFLSDRQYSRNAGIVSDVINPLVGYILVVSPEVYRSRPYNMENPSHWNYFLLEGGVVTKFPVATDRFKEEALDAAHKLHSEPVLR